MLKKITITLLSIFLLVLLALIITPAIHGGWQDPQRGQPSPLAEQAVKALEKITGPGESLTGVEQ